MARSVFYFTDSADFGGAERALLLLLEHLDREAWRPTLLYHEAAGIARLVEAADELGVDARAVTPAPDGLGGARRVPELVRELRSPRPDVFHAHLTWPLAAKFPLAAAGIARVPAVVATVHLFPEFTFGISTYAQERLLALAVDRYIAVSDDIAEKLVERLHWPRAKIEVIHNGVPVDPAPPADPGLRSELAAADAPLVVAAGRLTPQKGFDVLVRAAASLPGVCFAIAGDGPERSRLEADARSLGVAERIRFLGARDDMTRVLAAADVVASPSRWEGTSLALLEAMAAGKPIVATAIGGTRELVVDGESGLLVPPNDAESLAAALGATLANDELAKRLAAGAHERVRDRFTIELATEHVSRLYRSLLDGNDHVRR